MIYFDNNASFAVIVCTQSATDTPTFSNNGTTEWIVANWNSQLGFVRLPVNLG